MCSAKVCYVAREMLFPPVEGHHVASRKVIEAATRAGVDSRVITIEKKKKNLQNPEKWVILKSNAGLSANFPFIGSIYSAFDDLFGSIQVAAKLKSSEIDLIHLLNVNKETYSLVHSIMRVKKPILTHLYHSPQVLSDDVFRIRNLAFRAGLYGCSSENYVLTTNRSLQKYFVQKLNVDEEQVHYAPYPIDTDRFEPSNEKTILRKKYGLPYDRPIVAYVGSLDPVRGIYDLIKAIQLVTPQIPNVLLYISHTQRKCDKIHEKRINELVKKQNLQNNILIHGLNPRVEELYNLANIVALPFQRPYWVDPPLVLLEAMSCGAAVITTPVGAIGEVIKDHHDGILTKARDPTLLAKNIGELVENSVESNKIGQKARETIIQNYSYNVVGNMLLKIYNFILCRQK
jgi:glycosyltransferase involved in cell wall biosynthesis